MIALLAPLRTSLMPLLPWIKALHVVAVIAWMAGILYLYRLFVYHREEKEYVVKERLVDWERRLMRFIANPAMIVAWLAGLTMVYLQPSLMLEPWFHAKLTFAVLLTGMQGFAGRLHRKLASGEPVPSGKALRILNEVPTLLMIGIVVMVIVQPWSR